MMILCKFLYTGFFLYFITLLSASPASAEVTCKEWNTYSFFSEANPADVTRCLQGGADVNARDDSGNTPLHIAASYGKTPAVITVLLNAGADVNARNMDGNTSLHDAVHNKIPAVTTALLKSGADVSAKNKSGKTPLQFAMEDRKKKPAVINVLRIASERERGREAERRRLAKSCAKWNTEAFFEYADAVDVSRCLKTKNPNARNRQGETPLHKAVVYNKIPAVIAALLNAGAGVNAKDAYGNTPLHDAARYNKNPAVITALLKAGAEVNARTHKTKYEGGETPLHNAARNENPAVTAALLKAGAEINARTYESKYFGRNTPLHFAARNENLAVITTLLKAGADPNARKIGKQTPLHNAARNKNPAVITVLLKAGAKINAKDEDGETPLHFAAGFNKNPAVITVLLKAGAEINAKDEDDETPLHHAAWFNENPAVITTLVSAGAQVNARENYNNTPLHYAAWFNENPAVITTLVSVGAQVNARNNYNTTPLHKAADNNKNPAVVTALVAAGAEVNAKDKSGNTPLQEARERKKNSSVFIAAFSAQAVAAFREKERKAAAAARKREMERRLLAKRVACGKWNTSGYFKHAAEKDVSRCLGEGAEANVRNRYDETPLHMAAKFSKAPAVIAALKKAGADLKARDKKGRTPLHTAAVFGKTPAVVEALIKGGADLKAKDKKGRTPLEFARKFSRTPAVVAVLQKASARKGPVVRRQGAARVSCAKWNTPGFFSSAGLADLSRCLKTKNPNARNRNGRTPLHYAAQGEAPEFVAALVKAGAAPDARDERGGWTPLHLAAWFGKTPAVVAALLSAGADPAARDKKGKTPRDYAEQNAALRNTDVFSRLKEGGVKKAARPSGTGRVSCDEWNTPAFFQSADLAVLSRCLKTKKAGARNQYGRTPLHYAAQGDAPALVGVLVKAGADPNAKDKRGGWTPLHLAAQTSRTPGVVSALIQAGADPGARDKKGRTPLEFARKFNGMPAVVSALEMLQVSCEKWNTPAFFRSAGLADLTRCLKVKKTDTRDEKGRTPLHLAARFAKTPAVVKALLEARADPAARDEANKTPWDYAERNAALKDSDVYWRLNEERFR